MIDYDDNLIILLTTMPYLMGIYDFMRVSNLDGSVAYRFNRSICYVHSLMLPRTTWKALCLST